jgi:hypothetical protein
MMEMANELSRQWGAVVTTYINQYYEKSGTEVTTSYYLDGKLIAS